MAKPYSMDLREKVLEYLELGNDKKSASKLFLIGISTIYRWLKRKKETVSCKALKRKFTYKYIDDEELKKYVREHPDAFLHEIAENFSVTKQAIFYALKRLKITRKKKQRSYRERDEEKRKAFLSALKKIPPERRIYLRRKRVQSIFVPRIWKKFEEDHKYTVRFQANVLKEKV